MRRASVTAFVAAAAISLGPSLALAQSPRVGLLPLEVDGTLPPNGEAQLSAEIEQGVSALGATLVPASELAAASGGTAASCIDEPCLQALATKASATYLVRPSVVLEQSDYLITLAVIEGATGTVVHRAEQVCELCGLSEAVALAGTLAASLEGQLPGGDADAATLTIATTPAGAQVLLDGEPVGITPLELSVAPGEHQLQLRREGYRDEDRVFTAEAGGTSAVEAVLEPTAAGESRRSPSPLMRPLGWAAVGVGAAAFGSGVALLVLDGRPVEYTRCSGADVDGDGNCRYRHDTLAGGVMMTVVGVVGITAGVLLLVRSRKAPKPDDRRARLQPSARGMALHF